MGELLTVTWTVSDASLCAVGPEPSLCPRCGSGPTQSEVLVFAHVNNARTAEYIGVIFGALRIVGICTGL